MKVIIQTTFTNYTNNVALQPKAPYWIILNSGRSSVTINDTHTLLFAGHSFGVDNSAAYVPVLNNIFKNKNSKVQIVADTQYNCVFGNPERSFYNLPPSQLTLIETFIKIKK